VVYSSDGTCIIFNNSDLPASGATTFIRVGATGGNNSNIINGSTLIHNFCITYTTLAALNGSTISAGASFGTPPISSNMSVNVNNVPTNAVIVPAVLTFSSITTSCFPLPVKWLSFDASRSGDATELKWMTTQEINCAGFVVEHSLDGQNFEKIGEVPALSDQGDVNTYSFLDDKPFRGKNYYRIKQFDFDGGFDYSQIRTVVFDNSKFEVRASPNPANNFLNVLVQRGENAPAQLTLFNSTGQIVSRQILNSTTENIHLDLDGFGPGLYHLLVEIPGDTYAEKIIIVP